MHENNRKSIIWVFDREGYYILCPCFQVSLSEVLLYCVTSVILH